MEFAFNGSCLHGFQIVAFGTTVNAELREKLKNVPRDQRGSLAVEMPKASGMSVANEVFETCVVIGRLIQLWGKNWSFVFRGDVKLAICGSMRAKDPNVRAALIDLWGGQDEAIGGKKCLVCKGKGTLGRQKEPCLACRKTPGWKHPQGVLHGMSGDMWAALAVGYSWVQNPTYTQTLKPSLPVKVKKEKK